MNVLTVLLQAPAGAAGGGSMMWIMLIAMFVIMYFFMIRPQNKKQKEIANFRKSLQVNQSVITAGGIHGTIKEITDDYIVLEIASNVKIKIDKNSIFADASAAGNQSKKSLVNKYPMLDRRKLRYTYLRLSKRIKDFLLSDKSREFLIFLFFFLIASGFWLIQTLNNDYEAEFSIPVRMKDVPNNIVLTSEPPSELRVRVKDKGTVLLNYMLGKSFFPVNLSFPDYKGQNNHVKIFASEFEKKILSQLNASSKILSIKPDTLDYIYSTGKSKLVPVHFQGKVTAGLQYYVSDTICSPDSVLVYAPAGILDTITTAYTQEVNLENISDTIRQRVALDNKKGVKFVPASVELTFPVDIYTEKTVEVPLRGINFPADKVLRAFPSKVQITFQVGLKRFRSIKASDFVINVSYEELLKLGSDKYTVKLKSAPRGINQIRIVPEQVDFLIEQVSSDGY